MAEYASNAKGNAALTTGIIGTSLGALASVGGIAGLLGLRPNGQNDDPGDRPVTRYEAGLMQENAQLKAQQYADMRAAGLQQQISAQAVWNATQEGVIRCQAQRLADLYNITKLAIPAANIIPPAPVVTDPGTAASTTANAGT